jgi:hypothetical protein
LLLLLLLHLLLRLYVCSLVVDVMQLQQPTSIFLSHDWPNLITRYGNSNWLFSKKPYFQKEVRSTQSSTAMVCWTTHVSVFAC